MNGAESTGAEEHQRFMRIALQLAERGMAAGGPPVGACHVREGEVIGSGRNSDVAELDITAHAEIVAIRTACRELRQLSLAPSTLYVTVEPCAMCFAASQYAGIGQIVYGAEISAMQARTGHELAIPTADGFADQPGVPVLMGGVLGAECAALLESWSPPA